MPCKMCGKELLEGVRACQECLERCRSNRRATPVKIKLDDNADLVIIERGSREETPPWNGIYTSLQREDIRYRWRLTEKQINTLQEVGIFVRNLLERLGVSDITQLQKNDPRVEEYLTAIEGFLNKRNLTKELRNIRVLLIQGYEPRGLKEEDPFGAALCQILLNPYKKL